MAAIAPRAREAATITIEIGIGIGGEAERGAVRGRVGAACGRDSDCDVHFGGEASGGVGRWEGGCWAEEEEVVRFGVGLSLGLGVLGSV